MLTQVDVLYSDETGERALSLPILGVSPKDSVILHSITGLGPPEVTPFVGEFVRDGGYYQGRRAQFKNPVLTVEINPNPALGETVSGLRQFLQKVFMSPRAEQDHVGLLLHDETGPRYYIYGYTERFEGEVFSDETMVQISMISPDPFVRAHTPVYEEHPSGWSSYPILYRGTAPAGYEAQFRVVSKTDSIHINLNGRELVFETNFDVGDWVYINTSAGQRAAHHMSRGLYNVLHPYGILPDPLGLDFWGKHALSSLAPSIMTYMTDESRWSQILDTSNVLTAYSNYPTNVVAVLEKIRYTPLYWGL